MAIAILFHDEMMNHVMGDEHPENPERLRRILSEMRLRLGRSLVFYDPPKATKAQVAAIHGENYMNQLEQLQSSKGCINLDEDTLLCPGTLNAAYRASGAAISATELVMSGAAESAFVVCRPPGHHAEKNRANGFCFFNHVAVAAQWALDHDGVERVAIVDFDAHQCNGTLDIFADRQDVKIYSSFQHPWYPNSHWQALGHHQLWPLEGQSEFELFRQHAEQVWQEDIIKFKPQLILVSAGFDAHQADPLSLLNWQTQDFHWIGQWLKRCARLCGHSHIVSCLEGGYDLDALSASVIAYLKGLNS